MRFKQFLQEQAQPVTKQPIPETFLQEISKLASGDVDGAAYFDTEAVKRAYNQHPMSRETVVHMSPEKFLQLAHAITEPKPHKEKTINEALNSGAKLSDLPYLSAVTDAKGNLLVDGHEGRHRMMALIERGVKQVPVIIISGEGGEAPYRWGSTDKRPHTITGQDNRVTLSMPKIQTF